MGDPLIDLYNGSFATEHASRKWFKSHFRLTDSDLKRMSVEIQRSGLPAKATTPPSEVIRANPLLNPAPPAPTPFLDALMPQIFATTRKMQDEFIQRLPTTKDMIAEPVTARMRAPTATEQLAAEKAKLAAQLRATPNIWEPVRVEEEILFELYGKMVDAEWDMLSKSGARSPVAEFNERGGLKLYRELRPSYFREGVREPHKFIMDKMIEPNAKVTLAGVVVKQGIHKEFARIIGEVERTINLALINRTVAGQPDTKPLGYIGCFRPSPLDSGRPSNHMLGAAIDIDSKFNPHLKGKEIDTLDIMLQFWADYQNSKAAPNTPPIQALRVRGSWLAELPKLDAEDAVQRAKNFYDKTDAISRQTQAFLTEFLTLSLTTPATQPNQWQQKGILVARDMTKHFVGGVKRLQFIQANGFMSVPAELFKALVSHPELQWGLYTDVDPRDTKRVPGLDIMHFEVKPSVRKNLIIGPNGYP